MQDPEGLELDEPKPISTRIVSCLMIYLNQTLQDPEGLELDLQDAEDLELDEPIQPNPTSGSAAAEAAVEAAACILAGFSRSMEFCYENLVGSARRLWHLDDGLRVPVVADSECRDQNFGILCGQHLDSRNCRLNLC